MVDTISGSPWNFKIAFIGWNLFTLSFVWFDHLTSKALIVAAWINAATAYHLCHRQSRHSCVSWVRNTRRRTPEAAGLAKMGKHFSTANELKSNVQVCCVLIATAQHSSLRSPWGLYPCFYSCFSAFLSLLSFLLKLSLHFINLLKKITPLQLKYLSGFNLKLTT